ERGDRGVIEKRPAAGDRKLVAQRVPVHASPSQLTPCPAAYRAGARITAQLPAHAIINRLVPGFRIEPTRHHDNYGIREQPATLHCFTRILAPCSLSPSRPSSIFAGACSALTCACIPGSGS